jgi:hypothetical protein
MSRQKPAPQHLYGRFRFVEDPVTGEVHNMGDENSRDMINHHQWIDRGRAPDEFAKYVPPQKQVANPVVKATKGPKTATQIDDEDAGEGKAPPPLVPDTWAADDPRAELYELRKQAIALGVEVKHAMGKRSLEKAIAEAQAKGSSPAV